jgi:hypothetical protein
LIYRATRSLPDSAPVMVVKISHDVGMGWVGAFAQ